MYYYRSRRDPNGNVIKQYCGRGGEGEAAAAVDAERRAAWATDRQEEQRRRDAYERARCQILSLHKEANLILDAAMTAIGYHRHDRGTWRKKREQTEKPSPG